MNGAPIQSIVIVGGGTAGWMAAAALAQVLLRGRDATLPPLGIRVVESDEIGTIGVGEATIPHLRTFNQALGIDEDAFLRATQGTFKLGIEFVDWGGLGQRYIHGFGKVGRDEAVAFHHHWLRARALGQAGPLGDYSINTAAAPAGRFLRARPDLPDSPLADIAHAFHFDAGLYARFLRQRAEGLGVQRTEGRIVQVLQRAGGGVEEGFIEALQLASGERVAGDLFIDCSGLRGLLIAQTLGVGFDDWAHWLPCDRAVAVPSAHPADAPLLPMTRSTAQAAGWQWRIPLQHRVGNGHVYSSAHVSDDEAAAQLLAGLDGPALAEPRFIRFAAGKRQAGWTHNVVALGLASGFLEPLESTSIHLIQTGITRLLSLFPDRGFEPADVAEFNAQMAAEYEGIRDFLILHYHLTQRDDSAFWRHCRTMDVPASLRRKMALFAGHGRLQRDGQELFAELSWLQVMVGQGLLPRGHHPLADTLPAAESVALVQDTAAVIRKCVAVMPTQADFIAAHCAAPRADAAMAAKPLLQDIR
ncbi:tryptophan halogenase family protein [Ideonella sp. DXS22W]|uniref:Tryptophan halogenase family protein n=1 Tax=Pseudaquabacterium inlustre TaxID=2984192 RepID=A0ABU9CMY3_9BURK